MNKKVSVIVPLYNAANYLSCSLNSILMQTYTNFELLCIDDCSTDDTLLMLKDFQKIDKRIRIIENNTKMGAAYTRNIGLEEAKGKYVIFLDGDDIFDKKLLEKSIECLEQYNLDICFFDFTIARKNTEKRDEVIWERKLSNSKYRSNLSKRLRAL